MNFNEKILNRVSVRRFETDKKLSAKDRETLLAVMQSAPTSNNFFVSNVVVVEDKEKLAKLGELLQQKQVTQSVMFAVFLADINRLEKVLKDADKEQENYELWALLVAMGDAFIQATMLQDAAVNMGLGTCFIGGVRAKIKEINEILGIKGNAFPAVGLAVGFSASIHKPKPKMNRIFIDEYNYNEVKKEVEDYDQFMQKYWKDAGFDFDYRKVALRYIDGYQEDTKRTETIKEIFKLKK